MVNVKPIQLGKTTRMSFSKINEVIDMPNLIGIQKDSYEWFLQDGIKEVFRDVSPITDANGKYELSFISHRFDDKIKYTIEECNICSPDPRYCQTSEQGDRLRDR